MSWGKPLATKCWSLNVVGFFLFFPVLGFFFFSLIGPISAVVCVCGLCVCLCVCVCGKMVWFLCACVLVCVTYLCLMYVCVWFHECMRPGVCLYVHIYSKYTSFLCVHMWWWCSCICAYVLNIHNWCAYVMISVHISDILKDQLWSSLDIHIIQYVCKFK